MAAERIEEHPPSGLWKVALGVTLWWVAVGVLSSVAQDRWDFVDYAQGSHMGSEATEFWFVALVSAAIVLPGVVVPLALSWRGRYTLQMLVGVGSTTFWNTGFFYGTGFAECIPGRVIPGDAVYTLGILVGLAACPFAAGLIAGHRRSKYAQGVAIATAIAAVNGFLWVVQASTCSGISKQVTRGWEAPLFPLFVIVTLPFALLGIWLGRRMMSSHSSNHGVVASSTS